MRGRFRRALEAADRVSARTPSQTALLVRVGAGVRRTFSEATALIAWRPKAGAACVRARGEGVARPGEAAGTCLARTVQAARAELLRTPTIDALYLAGAEWGPGHVRVEFGQGALADPDRNAAAHRRAAVVPRSHSDTVRVGRAGQIVGIGGERAGARVGVHGTVDRCGSVQHTSVRRRAHCAASGGAPRYRLRGEADQRKQNHRWAHGLASQQDARHVSSHCFFERPETTPVPERAVSDTGVARVAA
jgi:hypothetical protein